MLVALFSLATGAVTAEEVCIELEGGGMICYDVEFSEESFEDDESAPDSDWSGYFDGRLSPDPDEYYSIWCAVDHIEIWRSVPDTELLTLVPLAAVIDLSEGQALNIGEQMALIRHLAGQVQITGNNGNRAPDPGVKYFSLEECIARNGGLPGTGSRDDDAGADELSAFAQMCIEVPGFFNAFTEDCMEELGYDLLTRTLIRIMWTFCSSFFLAIALGGLIWRRRR